MASQWEDWCPIGLPFLSASSTTLFGSVIHKIVTLTLRCIRQRQLLTSLWFILINFSASAETIPYKNLVGVWTSSQRGVNHDLTDAQVFELCGSVFSIVHPDCHFSILIRANKDGKLFRNLWRIFDLNYFHHLQWVTPTNSSQVRHNSTYLPLPCKTNRLMLYIGFS